MSTKSSGRQNEDALKTQALSAGAKADESITKAETEDPMEAQRRAYVKRILDWQAKPTSLADFPDQTGLASYRDAKAVTDAGRVGQGYGTLSDGGSEAFSSALGKELESERSLEASGRLDDYVTNAITGAQAEAGHWADVGNSRNMNVAGLRSGNANAAQDRYQSLLANKKPSFLKQMALGMLNNGEKAATMLAGGV